MTTGNWINAVLALSTTVMAVVIGYLASCTHKLAKDTVSGIRQAERHHQEDSRPFCIIEFANADATSPFGTAFQRQRAMTAMYPSASGADAALVIDGRLSNKGRGPATDTFSTSTCVLGGRKNTPTA